jgi:HSP20 family protein
MTIVTWTPFMELDSMERSMRRWFEGFSFAPAIAPATDIYETDDEYVVEVDVPGFEEKELAVEVFDHTLAIKGQRGETQEKKAKEFTLHQRLEREFERRFVLPIEADTEHLKATFAKGVVEVHAPKVQKAKPKTVTITKT